MAVGDRVEVERYDAEADAWELWYRAPALQVNKGKTSEYYGEGGEQVSETVDFRLRWHPKLAELEFGKPLFRLRWCGHTYDVRGYDDYMYQHRTVTLKAVSHG